LSWFLWGAALIPLESAGIFVYVFLKYQRALRHPDYIRYWFWPIVFTVWLVVADTGGFQEHETLLPSGLIFLVFNVLFIFNTFSICMQKRKNTNDPKGDR